MLDMKKITFLFTLILMAGLIFTSCEKEEKAISGDSALKVINNCTYDVDIYFDDDFIGEVAEEATRTWSVPSGTHEVRASSYIGGVTTENPTFIAGQTIIMTLSSGLGKSADVISADIYIESY